MKKLFYIITLIALIGCYSNNCPVNNIVTCNYYFYDLNGTAISYSQEITVSAILPGGKNVYVYRKMGETSVTTDTVCDSLVKAGYAQSIQFKRNDTILINKASSKQYLEVPMSYFNECDTLLFTYSNISLPDTMYVWHDSYAHVDLPECGSFRYHNITNARATDNAIDHIEIVNPTVNYDQKENIKIYFYDDGTSE